MPRRKEFDKKVAVRLTEEQYNKAEQLGKESELSPSDVIRKAIDAVTRKDLDMPERKKTGRV